MQSESIEDRIEHRLDGIVSRSQHPFSTETFREALSDALREDAQLRSLLKMAVLARVTIETRGYGDRLDPLQERLHDMESEIEDLCNQRRLELIARECSSRVQQDDRWLPPDEAVNATTIQTHEDAILEADNWLQDHTTDLSYLSLDK